MHNITLPLEIIEAFRPLDVDAWLEDHLQRCATILFNRQLRPIYQSFVAKTEKQNGTTLNDCWRDKLYDYAVDGFMRAWRRIAAVERGEWDEPDLTDVESYYDYVADCVWKDLRGGYRDLAKQAMDRRERLKAVRLIDGPWRLAEDGIDDADTLPDDNAVKLLSPDVLTESVEESLRLCESDDERLVITTYDELRHGNRYPSREEIVRQTGLNKHRVEKAISAVHRRISRRK